MFYLITIDMDMMKLLHNKKVVLQKMRKLLILKKYIHNQLKFLLKFTKIFLMINLKMS